MLLRRRHAAAVTAALLAFAAVPIRDAEACGGGTFTTISESGSAVVTGHRVAISISMTQTVLWDQIAYSGKPSEFAWVLPAPKGASVDVAADAWLEALDTGTTAFISSPEIECAEWGSDSGASRGGCSGAAAGDGAGSDRGGGAGNFEPPPVTVVHQGTVGPYETVTIHSDEPGAIGAWLTEHQYNIPADVSPILDAYAAEGLDFIALRLKPGASVTSMKPVRVVYPGAQTTFPLKMLSAGAGDHVALKLFVISEGRMQPSNFPTATVSADGLVWDLEANTSNYGALREEALKKNDGATWLVTHADHRWLLSGADGRTFATSKERTAESIGDLYFMQGFLNDEGPTKCDGFSASPLQGSPYKVVDGAPGEGEIAAHQFACEGLDDLAVALVGMHPKDVWLTRLEANLPRAALAQDLVLAPDAAGAPVESMLRAKDATNLSGDCDVVGSALWMSKNAGPSRRPPLGGGQVAAGLALAGVVAALARRSARRRLVPARAM